MSDAMSQARDDWQRTKTAEAELESRGWTKAYRSPSLRAWWMDPLDPDPEKEPMHIRDAITVAEGRDAIVREVMES